MFSFSFTFLSIFHLFFLLSLSLSMTEAQSSSSRGCRVAARRCLKQPDLVCVLKGTGNSSVSGVVNYYPKFRRTSGRHSQCFVHVSATLSGFTPGLHGFHIHTYGDLRSTDGTWTGGHFSNPKGDSDVTHGFPESKVRHWGDLGNIVIGDDGEGYYERYDSTISITGIVGRGVIVHALGDRGPEFQPTGAAGARQAMCVIGIANPDRY